MAQTSWKDLIGKAEEPADFTPLPVGTYEVKVDVAEYAPTRNGKDMYKLTLRVTQGASVGRLTWTNLVVSPESPTALGIFFRDMNTLGVSAEYLASEPGHEAICAKLMGAEASVSLKPRKDDPTRTEVSSIRARVLGGTNEAFGTSPPPAAPAGFDAPF